LVKEIEVQRLTAVSQNLRPNYHATTDHTVLRLS